MTDVKEILETVNWVEVHRAFCFPLYGRGTGIHIFSDGSFVEVPSNTIFEKEPEGLLGIIAAEGIGNLDTSEYLSGWTQWDDKEGKYRTDTDELVSFEEAVLQAIEQGEWDENIQLWKEKILAPR